MLWRFGVQLSTGQDFDVCHAVCRPTLRPSDSSAAGADSYICLTKLLNVTMVRNFEVMLGQTVDHSEQNFSILCDFIDLKLM
jgi:hypothetical protein